MPPVIVWIFLTIASVFATVHGFAVKTSLYWYYSWFDIVMHFWGGMLVVMGVHALCSLKHVRVTPTAYIVFGALFSIMIGWEIFERWAGLYSEETYVYDVSKDILVGLGGGLLGYLATVRLRMYR